ncbi:tetratricopeptide repeat protein [Candidatus Methylomirabilis sp.]|uniref:tetratricopeptide repeat protein n=1 Tax=Candidatus Methylomirabilis sp. TaxID=2032687 RepID=UPI002A62F0B2|nr:tetratricopeptide repeat protein [Candidatus Methylomirabilis sp.]
MEQHTRWSGWMAEAKSPVWLRPFPVMLLLAALAGLTYVNALPNSFVFDDKSLSNLSEQLQWLFDDLRNRHLLTYRPLRTASYAIDYAIFGLNPAGFRAFNILYHVLNGALLFTIVRAVLKQSRLALLAAVLFIVHPIQTESVAYISGRRDVLFTLFYLAGLYGFIRYRETSRIRYLCLAGFSYLLSLLTKEMAITLPLLWLCYDLIRSIPFADTEGRSSPWKALRDGTRTLLRRHAWFYLLVGILLSIPAYYYTKVFVLPRSLRVEMWGGGIWPTLLTSVRIFAHYLTLMVFPMTLSADYSFNAFPISYSFTEIRVIVAFAILGGVWWGLYRLLASDRWAAFGGLWFFVTLLPVSQIIPHHEIVAEHYLYLPSAGFCLAAAVLVERLLTRSRNPRAIAAAFALIVLLLGLRTVARNRDWKDELTLWTRTVQTSPQSARAHIALAGMHLRQGRYDPARQELVEALRIQPHSVGTHSDLGVVLLTLRRFDEAEREFREAIRLSASPSPGLRVNLALAYLGRSQFHQAEQELSEAFRSPLLSGLERAAALHNQGLVYAKTGRPAEAERVLAESLNINPKNVSARMELAALYLENGMLPEGATQLEETLRYKGPDADLHALLGEVYYRLGRKDRAAAELTRALSLKGNFPEAKAFLKMINREIAGDKAKPG